MFLKYLQGSNVFRDETDGEADGGGTDRGDELELDDDVEKDDLVDKKVEAKDEEVEKDDLVDKKVEKKTPMVPHSRMKEAVEKERKAREASEARAKAAEDKLEESNRGVDTKKLAAEIEDLDDKLDKAIADNDLVAKKALRAEIREKQMTLARAEAGALAAQATAMAVERVRYDALVERLEKEHPAMNPEADEYDEDVVAEIVELKSAYEAKGDSSSDALKKAAKYVLRAAKEEKKEEVKDDDDETDEAAAKAAAEERRAAAVKKAAAVKQPVSKGGKASDKGGGGIEANVAKMSDADFDKLDPKEVARLRGDAV